MQLERGGETTPSHGVHESTFPTEYVFAGHGTCPVRTPPTICALFPASAVAQKEAPRAAYSPLASHLTLVPPEQAYPAGQTAQAIASLSKNAPWSQLVQLVRSSPTVPMHLVHTVWPRGE